MWTDDYHNNFVRPDNKEELEELVGPLFLYKENDKTWEKMYSDILQCIEIFGYGNVSLYHNDYMKYGDHLEPFLYGFWVNLQDGKYNEGSIEFENATILIENGFMFVHNYKFD
jgi:hypothetical protein